MKVFNRIVMAIGALAAIVGALFLVIRSQDAAQLLRAGVDWFDQALYNERPWQLLLVAVVVVVVIGLIVLVLELRSPRKRAVRIRTKSGANAVLGVDSVSQSLEFRIDELAGVRKVTPHVVSRGKDVDVTVNLDTSPSVNIPVLTDQVVELCRDIVEGQLGVKIHGKVAINVHHEPYPRGTMPPTSPMPRGTDAIATLPRMVEKVLEPAPEPAARPAQPEPVTPERQPRFRRKLKEAAPEPVVAPVVAPEPLRGHAGAGRCRPESYPSSRPKPANRSSGRSGTGRQRKTRSETVCCSTSLR